MCVYVEYVTAGAFPVICFASIMEERRSVSEWESCRLVLPLESACEREGERGWEMAWNCNM